MMLFYDHESYDFPSLIQYCINKVKTTTANSETLLNFLVQKQGVLGKKQGMSPTQKYTKISIQPFLFQTIQAG
jgi:hypothetical protein